MATQAKLVDRHRSVIDLIKNTTVEVAAAHRAYLDAWTADRDAYAELLAEVVNVVVPALPALASRVITGCEMTSLGTSTTDANWRGVPLLTDTGEPFGKPRAERSKDPERGRFGGRTLYLTPAGTFMEMSYDGSWSNVDGEVSSWKTTGSSKSPTSVANEWDVEAILDALALALQRQVVGAKEDRTRAMIARAERIAALAKLARAL